MKIIFVVSALAFAVGCAKPVDADSADYAARCMAAAAFIKPIAEAGEIADIGAVEIYEAVESFWSEKVTERAADSAAADTARAAAMADMDLAAGTGSQAAINNARELLRACEASNG